MTGTADAIWMQRALTLAEGRVGHTLPNPPVGCVIVDSRSDNTGQIAWGVTGDGGRPHAEEIALAMAGDAARGSVAYVTLEPCSKRSGGGISCARRLIAAGVERVVIGCLDLHALGGGAIVLADAGLEVSGLEDDTGAAPWAQRAKGLDHRYLG